MAAILLLAAFIAVPLLEIAVFIQVGGLIGLWPTLALVLLTAVAGTWLLRLQGLATLSRARSQLDQGVLPARELFDGLCLLFAGALLLTPGFVTDALGLLLFVPALRDLLRTILAHRLATAETRVWVDGAEVRRPPASGGRHGDVIDADYRDITPEDEEQEAPPERRLAEEERRRAGGGRFRP
ncbi:MAG: FxsA family protein [Kiloniellales bacterium]